MSSALHVVTSDRLERLADRLLADFGGRPLSPFEQDVVVVQSQGTARWLRNTIATRTGCAASIEFPFPASFCRDLARRLGQDGAAVDPAFGREAMTWRILELLAGGLAADAPYTPLRRFVEDGDMRKQVGLASRIAMRFDDYQMYRPAMLLEWEAGQVPDDAHARWQADLWRRLCGEGAPTHLARWFAQAIDRIAGAGSAPPGLPPRVAVFGVSTLPPVFIRLLQAVGRFLPVTMYVGAPPRAAWPGPVAPGSALYRAFGATSRELLALCEGSDPGDGGNPGDAGDVGPTGGRDAVTVTCEEIASGPLQPGPAATALAILQADVRSGVDRGRGEGQQPPAVLPADDHSLTLHSCHSPMREVEVLRDQLLAAFAADPTLRPHDVLVMVPDVPGYEPLFETVFGVGEQALPRIPFRVADRALGQESGIAAAMLRLLRLAGSRCTAPEVLALFDVPAVRRAAGLSDGEQADVAAWVRATGIRWGRDGAMRAEQFRVPAFEANSWQAGLDRLLMGYATGPTESLVAGVLPHAGHTTGDAPALGTFANWVARLFETLDGWRTPRPLGAWGAAFADAAREFLAPGDAAEREAMTALLRCIDSLAAVESSADAHRAVELPLVRDWLERLLGDDSKGRGFLTGGMTVCALKPMRAIPFRCIAVLGLGDDAFPRRERRTAFDMLDLEPQPGDPDRRADDRQLFLDTIMAARDRLLLSWVGRSVRNNAARAVSVVVAELLDVVDRTFEYRDANGQLYRDEKGQPRPAREGITCEHPLQPFSAQYFTKDEPPAAAAPADGASPPTADPPAAAANTRDGSPSKAGPPPRSPLLFSFSLASAGAFAAGSAERAEALPFVTQPLPAARPEVLHVGIHDLASCWTNAASFFCQRALALRLPVEDDPLEECEPLAIDKLVEYDIQNRLLRRHLGGSSDAESERVAAVARSQLPPEPLGPLWFDVIHSDLAPFLRSVGTIEFQEPEMVRIAGNGWLLTGRVDGLCDGQRIQVRPAKVKGKDLVRAWICHLALSVERGPWETRVIGTDREHRFGPVIDPRERLEDLIAGYRDALTAPLPVFERASRAFVDRELKGSRGRTQPIDAARSEFESSRFNEFGDDRDAYVQLCWRGRDPLGPEFASLARRLWTPVFAATRQAAT